MRSNWRSRLFRLVLVLVGLGAIVVSYCVGLLMGRVGEANRIYGAMAEAEKVQLASQYRVWRKVSDVLVSGSLEEREQVAEFLRAMYEPLANIDALVRTGGNTNGQRPSMKAGAE